MVFGPVPDYNFTAALEESGACIFSHHPPVSIDRTQKLFQRTLLPLYLPHPHI